MTKQSNETKPLEVLDFIEERSAEDIEAEHRAERYAENAWLRHAEYDPEAQDEEYRRPF